MQKDIEIDGAKTDLTSEDNEKANGEAAAPKKAATRKNSSSQSGSAKKKTTSSAKKSPTKKTSSTKTSAKKSASSKDDSEKDAVEKKAELKEKSAEEIAESSDSIKAKQVAKISIPSSAEEENITETAEQPPLPSSPEDTEKSDTDENQVQEKGELIVPEVAEFNIENTEDISIIPDEESENKDGLLNVEHFSDYSPEAEKKEDVELYYEVADVYEESITILENEEPEQAERIASKVKYEDPDREKYDPKKPRKIDGKFDFIELFVFTLLAVILLTTFIFRHAVVEGPSMQNTLQDGEHLIISDLFYTPKKGDIIVCQDRATGHFEPIVKRIIATEGDTVSISAGIVYVNGEALKEDYVFIDGVDKYSEFGEVTVPEDMLFVMGDHRNNSSDSRAFITTFVREDAVLGKVILRFYPFDKFGKVD